MEYKIILDMADPLGYVIQVRKALMEALKDRTQIPPSEQSVQSQEEQWYMLDLYERLWPLPSGGCILLHLPMHEREGYLQTVRNSLLAALKVRAERTEVEFTQDRSAREWHLLDFLERVERKLTEAPPRSEVNALNPMA